MSSDCFYVPFLWRLVCFESEKAEIYFFLHLCDLTQGQSITCFHSFGCKNLLPRNRSERGTEISGRRLCRKPHDRSHRELANLRH